MAFLGQQIYDYWEERVDQYPPIVLRTLPAATKAVRVPARRGEQGRRGTLVFSSPSFITGFYSRAGRRFSRPTRRCAAASIPVTARASSISRARRSGPSARASIGIIAAAGDQLARRRGARRVPFAAC